MKVRMMVEDPEGTEKDYNFNDLYIDEDQIQGFFIPDLEQYEESLVNIVYPSLKIITVEAEKGLQDFLVEKFIDKK